MQEIIAQYIGSYLSKKLLETSFIGIKNAVKRINKDSNIITIKKSKIEDCIEFIGDNIEENKAWATNISFQGAKTKSINDIFIDINLFVSPRRERITSTKKSETISINELLIHSERNIVLLGDPGAGKTTSIKKIFLEVLEKKHEIYETFNVPIIIRLKDIEIGSNDLNLILFNKILSSFGVFIEIPEKKSTIDYDLILKHIFREFIERLNVLIILDGFDEISNDILRQKIIQNIKVMSNSLINSRFILTCRSADYNLNIENTDVYEISPLNKNQITDFINKWLKNEKKSAVLQDKLAKTPYGDTLLRPLILAQMCAIFEKYGDIPDKPKTIYDKIVLLLLEDWSIQNSVVRVSRYAAFGTDRKKEFLSTFAYHLIVLFNHYWFNKELLSEIYRMICTDFGLPISQDAKVINEIESHNGLIIQSSIDRFEFAHRSIAEYLVASYLVKMPQLIKDQDIIKRIPNEIAILISISSGPSFSYFHLIHEITNESILDDTFLNIFLSRLIVENPDFERINPLFALTNIYILNIIAKKIFIQYDRVREILENSHERYYDCIQKIYTLSEHKSFKESIKELKQYYRIEKQINFSPSQNRLDVTKWDTVYSLTRIGSLKYMGNDINLPNIIFMPEKLLRSSKN